MEHCINAGISTMQTKLTQALRRRRVFIAHFRSKDDEEEGEEDAEQTARLQSLYPLVVSIKKAWVVADDISANDDE